MIIKKIKLINFRNYHNITINFSNHTNIIIGNNAQGKTNILESIYTLALTKSYRTTNDSNLIKFNEKKFIITGEVIVEEIPKKLSLELYNGKKIVKLNDNPVKKISDYVGNMYVILSSPDDLQIIKGTPADRRNFLNIELSQISKNYLVKLTEYNKLLKMRNDYLKLLFTNSIGDYNYLDILTNNIIDREVDIYKERKKFIDEINKYLSKIYKKITNIENLYIEYVNNIELEDYNDEVIRNTLKSKYKSNLHREISLGMTLYGPHRDDLIIKISDEDIKLYGSQGQQKLAFISIKLSEIKIFEDVSLTKPIILLDDIFSELDKTKKNNLIKYIDKNYQLIITSNDIKDISKKIIKDAKIFKIGNNKIVEEGAKDGRDK